ncbi:MAG TPA: GtrA family protein [Lichenihabitans sp.]|nr:GtrA family protein [Lichenihabitans sp.]
MSALPAEPARRASALRFLRFCCVGAAGFVTDTGILLALVHLGHVDPIVAKAVSFAVAVLVTFDLNRRWAFEGGRDVRPLAAFPAYLAVQGVGFLCNWTVFTACIILLPKPFGSVLGAATIASAVALVLNYLGAARLVFGGRIVD